MAKSPAEDTSERKRISIPKADESVLDWWAAQNDPGLSVRLLIRSEIERTGYTDTAYRPVTQLPRRGRPAGNLVETDEAAETTTGASEGTADQPVTRHVAPTVPTLVPALVATPAPEPMLDEAVPAEPSSQDFRIDDLMNG